VVEQFLERQRAMYTGGDPAPAAELLDEHVIWHVPGTSPIAGDYRGKKAVLAYFLHRRALAAGSLTISERGSVEGEDVLVQLADGEATIGGRRVSWRTAGVYRVADGKIAEAWLVPLDLAAFDTAWNAGQDR